MWGPFAHFHLRKQRFIGPHRRPVTDKAPGNSVPSGLDRRVRTLPGGETRSGCHAYRLVSRVSAERLAAPRRPVATGPSMRDRANIHSTNRSAATCQALRPVLEAERCIGDSLHSCEQPSRGGRRVNRRPEHNGVSTTRTHDCRRDCSCARGRWQPRLLSGDLGPRLLGCAGARRPRGRPGQREKHEQSQ